MPKLTPLTTKVDPQLRGAIEVEALARGISPSMLIREILTVFLASPSNPAKYSNEFVLLPRVGFEGTPPPEFFPCQIEDDLPRPPVKMELSIGGELLASETWFVENISSIEMSVTVKAQESLCRPPAPAWRHWRFRKDTLTDRRIGLKEGIFGKVLT